MDHLWSPWRLDYVTSGTPSEGCVFCRAPAENDPLIVFGAPATYVILNRYPYNNGHVLVVVRRHVASLVDLTLDELVELASITQQSEAVLREAYKLEGINVGVNLGKSAGAGIHDHLHVHLVPRWSGDTSFMTVTGQTRVLPEELSSTAARLAPIYARLARGR